MLAANLHEYLLLKGKVCLPGIGSFERKKLHATFISTGQLAPPALSIHFTPHFFSKEIWEHFKQFTARKADLSVQRIEQTLNSDLEQWNTKLSEGQQVSLMGLGILSIKPAGENGEIIFNSFPGSKTLLPPLGALSATKIIREELHVSAGEIAAKVNTSDSTVFSKFWRELGIGFLIFLLCALAYYIFQLSTCSPHTKITNPLVELTHIDESRLNKDPAEFVKTNLLEDSSLNEEYEAIAEDSTQMGQSSLDTADMLIEEFAEGDSLNEKPNPLKNDCIIILGSFLKVANAAVLEDLLEDRGLDIYTGVYGNYKRIGVYESCDGLLSKLNDYRSSIDSGAWILQ
jgi:nucleoid DNA-binding protein